MSVESADEFVREICDAAARFRDINPRPAKTPRSWLSREIRAIVWDMTDGRCFYCHAALHPFRNFHVDHVVPLARGGDDSPENMVPSCQLCNREKSTRDANEFAASRRNHGAAIGVPSIGAREVAHLLSLSERWADRLLATGEIETIPGTKRTTIEAVDRFVSGMDGQRL